MSDLDKIKEAAARYAANHTAPSFMGAGSAEIEARRLALAVPDLLAKVERLTKAIREASAEHDDFDDFAAAVIIAAAMKEIEAWS